MSLVWYVGYGSNLSTARFAHYISGGRPAGASRSLSGCRDTTAPAQTRAVWLSGGIVFGWESVTWGGGVAFYDPRAEGTVPALAHLVTAGQFSDIASQEMHRVTGADLDLTTVLQDGSHEVGPGRYETLHLLGELEGRAMLTFSAPDATEVALNPPSDAYLRTMAAGLREAHDVDDAWIADYLASCPGADGTWSPEEVLAAIGTTDRDGS